ncbi:MAG TPA: hypothetical protein PLA54_08640 [Spirochaetota bacterium]|nr:hypothetical protein [Spirochaetota bacterium]HOF34653.1 hypothetical protein [Spirochaetota bacterium]HOU83420.1 hypothetical protein [Spirochaetota bacterium]HPK57262.1 hypothetical protein [Spirochaetota bacterium]HQE59243.1 hypothetical protein [Spirochaetota bacterium]
MDLSNRFYMINSKQFLRILSKIYSSSKNYSWVQKTGISSYELPEALTDKEKMLINDIGFQINKIIHLKHDDAIADMIKLAVSKNLEPLVRRLFLKAVGEGFSRGIQPIISYYSAVNMPAHKFIPYKFDPKKYAFKNKEIPCSVCGLTLEKHDNESEIIYDLGIGWCRLSSSYDHLIDLTDILSLDKPEQSVDNVKKLSLLLNYIENASNGETLYDLEKRISKDKILPNSTKTSRTWLLRSLSMIGIIPNWINPGHSLCGKYISYEERMNFYEIMQEKAVNHRSELEWPYSAWRGEMGIDRKLSAEIFPELNLNN